MTQRWGPPTRYVFWYTTVREYMTIVDIKMKNDDTVINNLLLLFHVLVVAMDVKAVNFLMLLPPLKV